MSDLSNIIKAIVEDTRYWPALLSIFILFMLLLVFDKLTEPLRTWFVPSLVVYAMGASFVGYLQTMWWVRRQHNKLAVWQISIIVVLHVFWIGCFIVYNHSRGAI